jgi:hypothetical protein
MNVAEVAQYLPPFRQKIMLLVLVVLAVYWLVRMVRLHRLREEHALLWWLGIGAAVVVVWCDPLLLRLTALLGVSVPASALLLLALFFQFLMLVWLTTVVSSQKQTIAKLIIAVSLLKAQGGK